MAMAPEPVIRLVSCPGCGYDLSALPPRHRCPECGFEYDESMFLLEGWRLPGSGPPRPETMIIGGAILLGTAVLWADAGWSWIILGAICAALLMVAVMLRLFARWRYGPHSRALVRYLITADGVARAGGTGRRIYLWRNYSHLTLMPEGEGAWRLHLYPSWWRLFGPPLVNARLHGDDAQAEAIRAEIQHRINTAHKEQA
jgi:hypothetical protein